MSNATCTLSTIIPPAAIDLTHKKLKNEQLINVWKWNCNLFTWNIQKTSIKAVLLSIVYNATILKLQEVINSQETFFVFYRFHTNMLYTYILWFDWYLVNDWTHQQLINEVLQFRQCCISRICVSVYFKIIAGINHGKSHSHNKNQYKQTVCSLNIMLHFHINDNLFILMWL